MGSCVSGMASTTLTENPDKKNNDAVALQKDCVEEGVIEDKKHKNARFYPYDNYQSNVKLNIIKVLPYEKSLEYNKKASLEPLNPRPVNKTEIFSPNESFNSLAKASLPKTNNTVSAPKQNVEPSKTNDNKKSKQYIFINTNEIDEDLETADQLLKELKEMDMNGEQMDKQNVERPTTRRGLSTENKLDNFDYDDEKNKSSSGETIQPNVIDQSPYSTQNQKFDTKYNETELRMIEEIEKEHSS